MEMQLLELTYQPPSVDHLIAEERRAALCELKTEMEDLAECFRMINEKIHDQGEELDTIEDMIERSQTQTELSVQDLKEAEETVSTGWFTKGTIACGAVALGGAAMTVVSPLVGVPVLSIGAIGLGGMLRSAFK